MYLENIGAKCSNCGNQGKRGKCNKKCYLSDNLFNWEPAEGVKIIEFSVEYPHLRKKGKGRQVIEVA